MPFIFHHWLEWYLLVWWWWCLHVNILSQFITWRQEAKKKRCLATILTWEDILLLFLFSVCYLESFPHISDHIFTFTQRSWLSLLLRIQSSWRLVTPSKTALALSTPEFLKHFHSPWQGLILSGYNDNPILTLHFTRAFHTVITYQIIIDYFSCQLGGCVARSSLVVLTMIKQGMISVVVGRTYDRRKWS